MDPIHTAEWLDNPRRNAWLADQGAAFPAWAQEHGGGWDFTPDSLDRLDKLIRTWFATWEEMQAAEDSSPVQVAAWYVGEVLVRHCQAEWRCSPLPPGDLPVGGQPILVYPWDALAENEKLMLKRLAKADEDPRPYVEPISEIRSMFAAGPDHQLRNVLEWFEDFEEWRRTVPGR